MSVAASALAAMLEHSRASGKGGGAVPISPGHGSTDAVETTGMRRGSVANHGDPLHNLVLPKSAPIVSNGNLYEQPSFGEASHHV